MRSLAPALLCPVLSLMAWADDNDVTRLKIEIKNQREKPVDQASVIVRFVEGRSIVKLGKKIRTSYELRTNQQGIASLPPIPQGRVRVQVIARNYQTFGDDFDLNQPEQTISITLNPPQPQHTNHPRPDGSTGTPQ